MARFLLLAHSIALAASDELQHPEDDYVDQNVQLLQNRKLHLSRGHASNSESSTDYYWAFRGGDARTSSSVSYTAPSTFSDGPAWIWPNELNEQVRHSPLIDHEKNVYISTSNQTRKFSSDGELLWQWHSPPMTVMTAAPALYEGRIFVLPHHMVSSIPTLFSIDMQTGVADWSKMYDGMRKNGFADAVSVFNGTAFFGIDASGHDGADTVVATNASDGSILWNYTTDAVMWNFKPSTPGDGTLIFSSSCGAVYKISFNGTLLWNTSNNNPGEMCSCGGGAVGPNGLFYAEYQSHQTNGRGVGQMAAYNVTDGRRVWHRDNLPLKTGQYPSIGYLGPNRTQLAVIVPMGDFPMPPGAPELLALLPFGGALRNSIAALDASTGETLWESEERSWSGTVAAGEMAPHANGEGICLPDMQSIPVISGDGTVYTSSSHHGDLRALRDIDGDGTIQSNEVSSFRTGQCFLNSPSLAPGMLVAAPCWGPVYVFKG